MSIEAMKQALEALEICNGAETADGVVIYTNAEINALDKAIAEAEKQEPVAWMWKDETITTDPDRADGTWTPLYTSPPKREPEPVECHTCKGLGRIYMGCGSWIHCDTCNTTGKATTPPKREWQGLTDEEIDEGQRQSWVDKQAFESAVWWAEAKLKEKNNG